MAIDLTKESLFNIQMYLQCMLDFKTDLIGFYELRQKDYQEQKVSRDYMENLEKGISAQVIILNNYRDQLESEITKRVRKKFPSIITEARKQKFLKEFEEELKKNAPKEEKKETPVLNMRKSREKKIDVNLQSKGKK